jgi:transcriptional regulator with XRE-family HTH domain
MNIYRKIGSNIKEAREAQNYTQEDVASSVGMSRSRLSEIENGKENITIELLNAISSFFKLPVESFLTSRESILNKWEVSVEELTLLIEENPSLRGFLIGYLAEKKLQKYLQTIPGITNIVKYDDHDRSKKHDMVFEWNGKKVSVEVKSLQTNSIKKLAPEQFSGKFQIDASDSRKIVLPNGETIKTTCLMTGEFDILAISLFGFRGVWEFAFILNENLPRSTYSKYSSQVRQFLLKTAPTIEWPLTTPYTNNIIELLSKIT